jgi:hypothetical protein
VSRLIALILSGKRWQAPSKQKTTRPRRGDNMRAGFESMSWINDKSGKEYVCYFENNDHKSFEELTEDERIKCADVNQIVGTERW